MRNILVTLTTICVLYSCTGKTTSTASAPNTSDSAVSLPYEVTEMNWQPGSRQNAVVAMAALKAFEKNNIKECVGYMADTVKFEFDGITGNFTRDSAMAFLQQGRDEYKSISVKMEDYESVISKNKDEYVSLWYKQFSTDASGKTDSVEVMNDIKMAKGKIVSLNEKLRHFTMPSMK
ncbi:MAG: hypothetical protein JWN76_2150 [Chitinophagaceae bacterium]|nr:hypothetical protein [Chitinophagaceae bacterium]